MAAIVTDQFRINNASNFLGDVNDTSNSYYVVVGLTNPGIGTYHYGRSKDEATWNASPPSPTDNFNYLDHSKDTMIYGKKISAENIRRVIRKITWTQGNRYEIYRQDYSTANQSPLTNSSRLYDANYYVLNKDFNVYVCLNNGSSGISTTGNRSQNEPLFTGLEPSAADGASNDGYVWKYLFSVKPSDIIKFDSTEYIPLPNDWATSTDAQIQSVRDNGNSDINNNQIKEVYIAAQGDGYVTGVGQEFPIIGDGSGAKVIVDVVGAKITKTQVSVGGKGYTYGKVNLDIINNTAVASNTPAKLIPIIPPSKGHGHDLYKELGADRVLIYSRFDDATKDFPVDTKFSQIAIVKNPTSIGSTNVFTGNTFSSTKALYLSNLADNPLSVVPGDEIRQDVKDDSENVIGYARGYVVSYDILSQTEPQIAVLKYSQDRSLYNSTTNDFATDASNLSKEADPVTGQIYTISGSNAILEIGGKYTVGINTSFSGITTNPTGNKIVELGVEFENGVAESEINNESGDIIYLDNRSLITRDERQKEDVKIILEF